MDGFETPYDEEAQFIECTVCDKSIRGDTLYKIHLTTPGHIKKEDVLVAAGSRIYQWENDLDWIQPQTTKASGTWIAGLAVRHQNVPEFEDIVQYLDYMKLDEPIIGLNYLEELPCNDPQADPRYTCKLCHQTANLAEMVRHVIGRKHRQKYVERKRPDLMTWDKQSMTTQRSGKIIRTRAEIIERQDGRGCPVLIAKKGNKGQLNISRGLPRQQQNRGQNVSQSLTQRDVSSYLPRLMDYSHQGRYPPGQLNTPPCHPEDPYTLNPGREMHRREDGLSHEHMAEEPYGADYRQSDRYRQEYVDPDYHREYKQKNVDDPQRRAKLEPGGVPRYDSRTEKAQHIEHYQEDAPPYRRPESDLLKEFYSEEVRQERVRSAEYQPSKPQYPEGNNHQWSLDGESDRHDTMNRAGQHGSSESEAKRRTFPTPMEGDRSREHVFKIVRDYCHKMRDPHQEEAVANPGQSTTGPPFSQREVEMTRSMSDIPEPFRRFLKGAADNEGYGKRKRKSRFSDATAEEVERTKKMVSDECGPPNPKFGGLPRPVSALLRPEINRVQHPDLYRESQGPQHAESYQRGGSESAAVFDMLKNIEIENAEEADFLKNKLCDLLKEFKAKKSEKAGQNSHGRAVIVKESNNLDPELASRHQYMTMRREDSDLRQAEDPYFQEAHRGRGWKQHIPEERLQEYYHPVHGEPREPKSNRSRYEEVFGQSEISLTSRATHSAESARYPERFPESRHPRDYRPAAEMFLDSHSSAPSLHMERGPRMDRDTRYSKKLEKITSTLLELVARK